MKEPKVEQINAKYLEEQRRHLEALGSSISQGTGDVLISYGSASSEERSEAAAAAIGAAMQQAVDYTYATALQLGLSLGEFLLLVGQAHTRYKAAEVEESVKAAVQGGAHGPQT